jgi:hypothetical protein
MGPAERLALAHTLLEPLAARLSGRVVQADQEEFVIAGELPDTRRHFELRARTADDEGLASGGEVVARVSVSNRLGELSLVHLRPDDEHGPDYDLLQGALYVSHYRPEERQQMLLRARRLPPGFAPAVEHHLATYERFGLDLVAGALEFSAGWFDDDEMWTDCARDLDAELRGLDVFATMVESVAAPATDVTCGFCGGRFALTGDRCCPHCGAPLR